MLSNGSRSTGLIRGQGPDGPLEGIWLVVGCILVGVRCVVTWGLSTEGGG